MRVRRAWMKARGVMRGAYVLGLLDQGQLGLQHLVPVIEISISAEEIEEVEEEVGLAEGCQGVGEVQRRHHCPPCHERTSRRP